MTTADPPIVVSFRGDEWRGLLSEFLSDHRNRMTQESVAALCSALALGDSYEVAGFNVSLQNQLP